MPEHEFTVGKLRDKIVEEFEKVGIRETENFPVEVWTQNGVGEYAITDVVFDDGVISIEVEPVHG